jgi:hypothetical protein
MVNGQFEMRVLPELFHHVNRLLENDRDDDLAGSIG